MAYTMADFRRDYIIDELPNLLQDKSIRKELVGEIVAVMLNQLSVDEIQTYLHQEESPSEDQKRLIKAIGRTLMLRFQVEETAYHTALETLPVDVLTNLSDLAITIETLTDFEAQLSSNTLCSHLPSG